MDVPLSNLALDRIEYISDAPKGERYLSNKGFHPKEYFQDLIGVTRDTDSDVQHVEFLATATEAPYIRTKPFHQSQRELGTQADGSVLFSLDVILNHELERDLLGYGEGVTVLSPENLVEKMQKRLAECLENYKKRRKT